MKSFLQTLFFLLLVTQICFAQWYWQNPIPGNTFSTNKVKFFDEDNGMVIGTGGMIYVTTNGGYSWGPVYTSEPRDLIDLSFINQNFGIIISEGSILKTSDGGLTWNKIHGAEPNKVYRYCSIADSLNFFVSMVEYGYVVRAYVLISNDGGTTWNQSSVFYGIPYDLYFINQNVGLYFVENKLHRTIDGGMSWTSIQFPNMYHQSISFYDTLNGIMVNNYTYRTEDGGLTWNQATSPPEYMMDVLDYAPNLILAVGSNRSIYKSTDQGETWTQLLRLGGGSSSKFTSISVVNSSYYVSGPSTIYRSSDSGASWFSIKQGTTEKLYSIDMVNRDYGISVGGNGVIVTTHNGGATWQIQNSGTSEYLYSVACIDTLNALAAGYSGVIIKTTDGGESWIPKNSGVSIPIYHLEMLDQNIGMAVGWAGTLLRTTDGGETWQSEIISNMNFWVSCYMDSSDIFLGGSIANGYGYILRSQNAGISWDTVYQVLYKYPHSICRLGIQSLIVSGSDGFLVKSTDMGSTWISLNSPRQYHGYASFIDSLNGLLCFMDGFIYRTTNGGNSWSSEWPFYSDLEDIQMLNIEDAVAVGFNGNIISTITDHIIPVELLSFSGYSEYGKVYLNWKTISELNNLMFEIERKIITDKSKESWVKIGYRKGRGTTTEMTEYNYVDEIRNINSLMIRYRLKQIDYNGDFSYSNIIDVSTSGADYRLLQNYPNPFNATTTINYEMPTAGKIRLKVYDLLGSEVKILVDEEKSAGRYVVTFDGNELSSGIYFYRIQAGDFMQTKKMILLK